MFYKTILVHVDDSINAGVRIELAARLARAGQAHLTGAAMTGISRFLYEAVAQDAGDPVMAPYLGMLRQRADNALKVFEGIAQRIGVASFEKILTDDEPERGLGNYARYADLAILGQYDPQGTTPLIPADLPEYLVMNAGCPVLIVPYAGSFDNVSERVLIAWNASLEALRAVRHAFPLLQKATTVQVAIFNPASLPVAKSKDAGHEIMQFLARHGIKADVMQEQSNTDPGEALLSLSSNLKSNLLVMGCYGHTRLREVLLGGVTRTILKKMTLPVLMSH